MLTSYAKLNLLKLNIRKAAEAADAGALAAIEAAKDGASDRDISAEMHSAMIKAGSEYPGSGLLFV